MKKIIFKLCTLYGIMFFILSCDIDYDTETKYTLVNNSNHRINMSIRNPSGTRDKMTLILNNEESKSFSFSDQTSKNSPFIIRPENLFVDTTIICYDDTICVIHQINYKCIKEDRCLLNIESYTGGYVGELYYKYRYEFTEEDYQKALEKFNN